MPIFIIVALILMIVVGTAIAYSTGLFKIEKVEVAHEDPVPDVSDFQPQEGEPAGTLPEDDKSLKEKMNLDGYFDEKEAPQAMDQKEAEEIFTNNDPLCDFKIGRSFLLQGQKALDIAKSDGVMYAAARFDLDRFRFINNLKGYSIGDYVLTRIGQEIQNIFPDGSQFTRISADHFSVVCPLVDQDMFVSIDEKLRGLSEKIRNDINVKSGLRICMGVAVTHSLDKDYDISILMHKANIARHTIKVSRSENYKIYEDNMVSSFLFGESALDDYNENQFAEDFVLYFVPQEDFTMHQVCSCEVLPRWACEDEGDDAFPLSLSKNMLPTNSSKVVYQVCKHMNRWRKNGKKIVPVCVSLTDTELFKADLDDFIGKCLSEFHLEPHWLSIAVDASILRMDWTVAKQIKRLLEMGVQVGVDEIDIGYKDLEFLSNLKFSFIKLHRSFAANADKDPERLDAARRMMDAAKKHSIPVVFEGVDTKEQATALQTVGGRVFQGLYCGKPQKSDMFVTGLPDHVEQRKSGTVILDDDALRHGF